MPAKYEAIRDKLIEQGYDEKEAKELASKIFNSQRKPGEEPVTRNYDKEKQARVKRRGSG